MTVIIVLGVAVNLLGFGDILPGAFIGDPTWLLRRAHFFHPLTAYSPMVCGLLLVERLRLRKTVDGGRSLAR